MIEIITTIALAAAAVIGTNLIAGLTLFIGCLLLDFMIWEWFLAKDYIQYFIDYKKPENKKFFTAYGRMMLIQWIILTIILYITWN